MLGPFLAINIIPAMLLMHPNIFFTYLYIPPMLGVSFKHFNSFIKGLFELNFVDMDLVAKNID